MVKFENREIWADLENCSKVVRSDNFPIWRPSLGNRDHVTHHVTSHVTHWGQWKYPRGTQSAITVGSSNLSGRLICVNHAFLQMVRKYELITHILYADLRAVRKFAMILVWCPACTPVRLHHSPWAGVSLGFLVRNKANLRDLIAATVLVILLKLDSNRRFFSPCDLEIWWTTRKTIGHLFYATLSFLHHFVAIGEFKLELQSGNA